MVLFGSFFCLLPHCYVFFLSLLSLLVNVVVSIFSQYSEVVLLTKPDFLHILWTSCYPEASGIDVTCALELRGKGVTQRGVRPPDKAVTTLDGDAPDSHSRRFIIHPGRIFRSLSSSYSAHRDSLSPTLAQQELHCPQVAAPQGPWWGARAGPRHIMTAVTDPQIARTHTTMSP